MLLSTVVISFLDCCYCLQYLFEHYVLEHVFASFHKDFQARCQDGPADSHIELSVGKHLLVNIDSDSEHALALSFVNCHGKTHSYWELYPYHAPWIVI